MKYKQGDRVEIIAIAKVSTWHKERNIFKGAKGTLILIQKSGHEIYGLQGYYYVEVKFDEPLGPYPDDSSFCISWARIRKVDNE